MNGLWFDVGRRCQRIDDERYCTVLSSWRERDRWAGRHRIRGVHWARVQYDDDTIGIVRLSKLGPA